MSAGHVFISHGSDDRDEAAELCAFIEARGIRTWIAPRDVRPGQDYSEQLQQAIEQCSAFVVLVTGKANSSPYVRAETEMAFSTGKPIFPVRQSDIQPAAGLAFFLKIRHWTDAFGKHGEAAMERLGLELEAVCGSHKPEPKPEPPSHPAPPEPVPVRPATPQPETAAPALLQTIPAAGATVPPTADTRTTPPVPAAAPLSAEQQERLAAAVGPNADYYLQRWRKMDASGSSLSWNWPAFFATLFWFAHRKMWLPLVAGVVLALLADFIVARTPALLLAGWLFLLALAALGGAFGNALYRRQATALVARADGLDQPVALAQLRAQGGVSIPGLVTALVIFLLLLVATAMTMVNRARPAAQTAKPSAAAAAPSPAAPAQADQPAPQESQPAADQGAPSQASAPTLDSNYLLGRWTSGNGDTCSSIFNSDGTFTAANGGRGYWSLAGDRLALTGTTTLVFQVVPVDMNNMTLVQPDGSLIRATRC
jgi:hypothetical protein